eukprot:749357-Hanusia_phi.AAC.2
MLRQGELVTGRLFIISLPSHYDWSPSRDRKRYELSLENHVQGQSVRTYSLSESSALTVELQATYRFVECLKPRTTSKAVIQEAGVENLLLSFLRVTVFRSLCPRLIARSWRRDCCGTK